MKLSKKGISLVLDPLRKIWPNQVKANRLNQIKFAWIGWERACYMQPLWPIVALHFIGRTPINEEANQTIKNTKTLKSYIPWAYLIN